MRTMIATSALALALATSPVIVMAQSTTPTDSTAPMGTQDTTAPTATTAPTGSTTGGTFAPAPDQQSQIDAWPAEQKTKYNAWPSTYQEYFWTLDADQQKGWWALTDEQKAQIYAMSPEQRTQVWPAIVAQVNGGPAPSGTMPATPAQPNPGMGTGAMPAQPATPQPGGMSGNMGSQNMSSQGMGNSSTGNMTAPPAETMNKKYPVCSKTVTDSCRNRGGV